MAKSKRAKVDPAEIAKPNANLFAKTEDAPAAPKPKADQRVDLNARATWQIGSDLKEYIKAESVRLGVPQSQLARYLLLVAADDFKNGRIHDPKVKPSESPAYRNVIDFD